VDEHVRAENEHELDGTMATLNETPYFKFNSEEFGGRDSVRGFYAKLFQGFPDFHVDVTAEFLRQGDGLSFLFA
jgi:SnoaL-like domain